MTTKPAFSLNISLGEGSQYYFSKNAAAAGVTKELNLEMPIGKGAFTRISYITFNYFGQLHGLRFLYEQALIGKDENSFYSLRLGAFYTSLWGNPVIAIKDNYVDQLPNLYHEIGIAVRPVIFYYNNITAALFDTYLAFDPLTFKKLNYGMSLITLGFSL